MLNETANTISDAHNLSAQHALQKIKQSPSLGRTSVQIIPTDKVKL